MNIRKAYRNAGERLRDLFTWHGVSRDDTLERIFGQEPARHMLDGEERVGWFFPSSCLRGYILVLTCGDGLGAEVDEDKVRYVLLLPGYRDYPDPAELTFSPIRLIPAYPADPMSVRGWFVPSDWHAAYFRKRH